MAHCRRDTKKKEILLSDKPIKRQSVHQIIIRSGKSLNSSDITQNTIQDASLIEKKLVYLDDMRQTLSWLCMVTTPKVRDTNE